MTSTEYSNKENKKGNLQTTNNPFQTLSEIPSNRKCTNTLCLIIFILCLLFLVTLTIFFSKGTNWNKFIYGYDKCGNTCGSKNLPLEGLNCSGKDMTNKSTALMKYEKINKYCPFSKIKMIPDKCIRNCEPPNQLIFHRCYPPHNLPLNDDSKKVKKLTEVLHIINQNLSIIVLLSFAGIVLTFGLFMCLRWHVAMTFWILTSFQFIIFALATTYLWHKYASDDSLMIYLISALGTTGYLVFLICFFIFFHGSFSLMFGLYEEAMTVILRIPLILFQPLLTLVVLFFTIISLIFLIFLISSTEYLKPGSDSPTVLEYVSNVSTAGYACYVIFILLWIYSFVDGYQTMIISGVVSNYYFTRDKSNLRSPFYRNSYKMLCHLGTAASGSLIVTLMIFMRTVAEYVVNKAYIQTAIHGTPFCTSAVRGIRLFCSNLVNALTLTGFNYIVINGFSFIAMLLTMLVGIWMNSECDYSFYIWAGLIFGAFGACLVTLFMMSVINITTETIFYCVCEDQILNDGNSRPYFMNERLRKLTESKMHPLNQKDIFKNLCVTRT